jgi:ribose transport system permease protein
VSQQISMLAVVAFTMTVVMSMGDFDLSVGTMASLAGWWPRRCSWRAGPCLGHRGGARWALPGGLLNGFLVSILGILPFVATLGTMTVFGGLAFVVSDGRTIFGRDIPARFLGLRALGDRAGRLAHPGADPRGAGRARRHLAGAGADALRPAPLCHRRQYRGRAAGRHPGQAPAPALAFTFTGMGAAIAGLMYASRVASANPTQGNGLMLDAIACVFLGMTMSEEGEPRVLGTLLGVLLLGLLDNGLTQMNVDSYIREVLVGTIIILAVASGSLGTLRRR